ncbi:MAG: glycosyltransferase family 2 protein [Caldilineales bacterium]|nr:glycosyltransferase family 2 protein [Caldilineales bacterium]MCW5859263.1 glycosyltransferase family 2 protein [Caldilineales bacterium]
MPTLSVLIPAHNEAENIDELVARTAQAFAALGVAGELVLVDDGSTDGTGDQAASLQAAYPWLRLIRHRRNRGLTAALRSGFRAAQGDYILFLPADLESDPAEDVPKLYHKLLEGYDVVSGWRQGRDDGKQLASGIYNVVSRRLFTVRVHDANWIKGFRREVIAALPPLRSDWHRFLLHIAADQGFRVGETPTNWYPRKAGRSHFGFSRIPISLLDVIVIRFLLTFSSRPMRFFGGLGLTSFAIAGFTTLFLTYLWFFQEQTQKRPVFWAALFLALAGLLFFLVGFLAELIVAQGDRLSEMEERLGEVDREMGRHVDKETNELGEQEVSRLGS